MGKTKHKKIVTKLEDYNFDRFLPTGSTMMNLLLSNSVYGGWRRKRIANLIGDSFTGKTLLAWTGFAETVLHQIPIINYFDEPELAFDMKADKLFGKNIYDHVIWEDNPKHKLMKIPDTTIPFKSSLTIEAMGRQITNCLIVKGKGKKDNKYKDPMLYIVDSFDQLSSEKETDEDDAGYGAARRIRVLNERMRKIFPLIKNTNSCVIIISQVRTNLDATFGSKKTRSGGKALKHWSAHELWLALKKQIIKTVKGKRFILGGNVVVKCTKNRVTGFKGEITFPVHMHYGIDDTQSMIDWLLEYNYWKKSKASIKSPFGTMSNEKLINYIEATESRERKLKKIVQSSWDELQDVLANIEIHRKKKY